MNEDVRDERAHEEQRGGPRILDADDAGRVRAAEVAGDVLQSAARRAVVVARIEGKHERRVAACVHRRHEVLRDGLARERHPLLGHLSEHDARVAGGIDVLEPANAFRQRDAPAHRCVEQRLLRLEVPEHRGRSDVQLRGDIGERGSGETLLGEHGAGGVEDLVAADGRRSAHL